MATFISMPDYLSDFALFIWELLTRWSDLAIGGIIGLLWVAIEKIRNRPISVKTFFVILSVSLFFAAFGAWREQFLKSEKPALWGEVDKVIAGESPDSRSTGVLLLVAITNTANPTLVEGFTATFRTGHQVLNSVKPSYLPENVGFCFRDKPVPFKKSEMLYQKIVTPIPQGGRVRGFLFYTLTGVNADAFHKDYRIEIDFKDATRNKYKFSTSSANRFAEESYYPGVEDPFLGLDQKDEITLPSPTPNTKASPH